MDLEEARKTLSKPAAFPWKLMAFLGVAGLCLVAGIALRAGLFSGQPDAEQTAPVEVAAPPPPTEMAPAPAPPAVNTIESVPKTEAIPKTPPPAPQTATAPDQPAPPAGAAMEQPVRPEQPAEPVEQAGPPEPPADPVDQAGQPESADSGMILIARQPVAMLASPSADAPAIYGFPAGRPFRVIGREGGFAKIKDLRSGASGWIDAAALAPPPPRAPSVSAPSPKAVGRPASASAKPSADPKPKPAKRGGQVTADSKPAAEPDQPQSRQRPDALFGRGGFFGGIFGGGN